MPSCCYGDEYESMFTAKEASLRASRFRRRGLRGSARDLVSMITSAAPSADTMLEVGGGAGEIGVALLESGAVNSVVNVELSGSWEAAADSLLDKRGLHHQVQRVLGDFVDEAQNLPAADLVVLHRVVCCYPDWPAMLNAAEAKSKRLIALTVPVDRWWTRTGLWMGNLLLRWRGLSFRGFIHPLDEMIELLDSHGLDLVRDRNGWIWRSLVLVRSS